MVQVLGSEAAETAGRGSFARGTTGERGLPGCLAGPTAGCLGFCDFSTSPGLRVWRQEGDRSEEPAEIFDSVCPFAPPTLRDLI